MRLPIPRTRQSILAALLAAAAGCVGAQPRGDVTAADPGRGRMLYETACATCHTEQAHWREKRLVKDWPGLMHQVTRWQQIAAQTWGEQETLDVAAYLNRRFYRLPCPVAGCEPDDSLRGAARGDAGGRVTVP